ncbi:hypothetical protein COD11_25205 [Bacillus sp. AFS040349]|nr:hypothetical protein COD11_25205 [Bacillus sp. AFS040349]
MRDLDRKREKQVWCVSIEGELRQKRLKQARCVSIEGEWGQNLVEAIMVCLDTTGIGTENRPLKQNVSPKTPLP